MAHTTIRSGTIPTSINNDFSVVYIKGNESTDGSFRFLIDDVCSIQKRVSGVWNNTKFRTGGSSLEIGRDLFVEAAGDFIKTENPSNFDIHINALIPHTPLSSGGTGTPHTPILGETATRNIYTTTVSEVSGTTLSQALVVTLSQVIDKIVFETGSVGSTAEIVLSIYTGTDNTGTLFLQQSLPSTTFVANTTATITLDTALGVGQNDTTFFIELVSSVAFSLDVDASSNKILSFISQILQTRAMLYEDLIHSNDLSLVYTNDIEHVYHNQF